MRAVLTFGGLLRFGFRSYRFPNSRKFLSTVILIGKFTAMIIRHFDPQPQFKHMNYFIYTSHHFTPHGRYELNKLASLPMCGFIAQLVEHRTGIAEVKGSNPVEALIFSGFFFPIA